MNIAVVTPTSEHRDFNDQRCNTDLHFSTQVNLDLIQDQIGAMFSQEKSCFIHPNTTIDDASHQGHTELKILPMEDWRKSICKWFYLVVDYFQIDREIVAISLNFLDRYLCSQHSSKHSSKHTPIDEHNFLLASVSALYLTTKVHTMNDGIIGKNLSTIEKGRRTILQNSIVGLCRGKFTADDICSMEQQILVTLSWKVNPITTSNFVEYFLRLMPTHSTVSVDCQPTYKVSLYLLLELSRYIAELAVCDMMISRTYLPSKIAMACIFLSMDEFNFTAFPWKVRNEFQSTLMRIYNSNSGNTPWNNDDDIEVHRLMEALSASFWFQLSINDIGCDHTFSLARKYGFFKPRWLNGQSSLLHDQPPYRQPKDEEDEWILVDDVNPIDDLSEDSMQIVSP